MEKKFENHYKMSSSIRLGGFGLRLPLSSMQLLTCTITGMTKRAAKFSNWFCTIVPRHDVCL